MKSVEDSVAAVVAELGENPKDSGKSFTLVVGGELLNVFKENVRGAVVLEDSCNIEEERAAGVVKALHLAHDGEGLAWETREEEVVRRDALSVYFSDVAAGSDTKVVGVGTLRFGVPLGGEDAAIAQLLKGDANASDAREEINEFNGFYPLRLHRLQK